MKKIVVLYHKDCLDGFGASWAAWKKFGNRAEYIPVEHQFPLPCNLKKKEVYILDFNCPLNAVKKLLKETSFLMIVDHHLSAKKIVQSLPNHSYALNRSGSVLSWKYFHPQQPIPKLLLYIEDADLWKFKLPFTEELTVALEAYEFQFRLWDKLASNFESPRRRLVYVKEGRVILRYQKELISRLLKTDVQEVIFEGYRALAANSSLFASEIGHYIVKSGFPIGIIWFQKGDKMIVSLRSNGRVNVSELAKHYGGGGHRSAAGFVLNTRRKAPWMIKK